jgi:hypothetical protein
MNWSQWAMSNLDHDPLVLASDYDALAAELAEMRSLVAALKWRATRIGELEAELAAARLREIDRGEKR